MVTREGVVMQALYTITADQIEEPTEENDWKKEQVIIANDPIEVTKVIDSGDAILVRGWSHITGDMVTYIITPDTVIEVWSA